MEPWMQGILGKKKKSRGFWVDSMWPRLPRRLRAGRGEGAAVLHTLEIWRRGDLGARPWEGGRGDLEAAGCLVRMPIKDDAKFLCVYFGYGGRGIGRWNHVQREKRGGDR
jgi:hypothetical protein